MSTIDWQPVLQHMYCKMDVVTTFSLRNELKTVLNGHDKIVGQEHDVQSLFPLYSIPD